MDTSRLSHPIDELRTRLSHLRWASNVGVRKLTAPF